MSIEEEEDQVDLQQPFDDIYKDSIMLAKKNEELKEVMESMAN